MDVKRKIQIKLESWKKNPSRKPLIIRGARQVGKTYEIRAFAKAHYSKFYEFNFERTPALKQIFEDNSELDPKAILRKLEFFAKGPIHIEDSLIFFDEIQECGRAITALRYFYEELPQLHIIAAGSLLEFALQAQDIPVGRIQYAYMYPLSFSEFLSALSEERLVDMLPRFENSQIFFEPGIHSRLIYERLAEYIMVGGMPEAVHEFTRSNSFHRVYDVHESLLKTFRDDILKYTRGDKQLANITSTLSGLGRFVGQEITYSTVNPDESYVRTKNSIELLAKAQLIHVVRSANPSGLPLAAEASSKHFKCILLDIGLMHSQMVGSPHHQYPTKNLLASFEGRMAEQFVGQQLLAESIDASEGGLLFCWIRATKNAKAEVDYLISRNSAVVPVEVKSGARGRLRSLDQIMEQYDSVLSGICLQHRDDVETRENCIFAPIFTLL